MSNSSETSHSNRFIAAIFIDPKIATTVGYYLAFITLGLIGSVIGPTLPNLVERTHSRIDEISIIFATRSVGYLLGSMIGGRAYDRISGHPVIAIMLLVIASIIALVPLIPLVWMLAAILFILGIAEGAVDVGANSMLGWLHGDKVGPFMNGLHFFFGLGAFIAPIVIAQVVLATGDITWAYWLLAMLMLPGVLWLPRLASPAAPAPSQEKHSQSTNWLLVFLIAAFLFFYVGGEIGYGSWVFSYATTLKMSDATTAAYLTSTFWGSFTIGRLLGIALSARFKARTILFYDLLVCLLSLGVIVLFPSSTIVLWLGTIGVGLGMASIYATMMTFAGQRLTLTGQITGFIFVGAGSGGMVMPWLIGQLFERIGAVVTMPIILVDVAIVMFLFFALIVYSPKPRSI